MRALSPIVAISFLHGCSTGGGSSARVIDAERARQMYVDAVDLRMKGNLEGSQDIFLKLAADAPDTRAGRLARSMTTSGADVLAVWTAAGIVAAIAVPNFIRYQQRSKQAVARAIAGRLRQQLERHRVERGSYVGALAGHAADPNWVLVAGPDRLLPDTPEARELLARARPTLRTFEAEPFVRRRAYRLILIADLDDDPGLDLWMIDSQADAPTHLSDDVGD